MRTLKLTLLFVFAFSITVFGQEKYASGSNGCVSAKARAVITNSGVYGAVEVKSNCSERVYIRSTKATVEVLEEKVLKDGKISKTWGKQTLTSGNLFLTPESIVTVDKEGEDGAWFSGVFTNLRNITIDVGEGKKVHPYQPNPNSYKVPIGATTKLFEHDKMSYSIQVLKGATNSGLWKYDCTLMVENRNGEKVQYQGEVRYKIWFDGIAWTQESKFKKVKDFDSDFFNSPAKFNYVPAVYIEFTDIPALEGRPFGNQVELIPKPALEARPQLPAESVTKELTTSNRSTEVNRNTIQSGSTSALLVDSDGDGTLLIDGAKVGVVKAGESYRQEVMPGEHLVKLISSDDPATIYSQVVEVKEGAQKVLLVKLMTPELLKKIKLKADKEKADLARKAEIERLSKGTLLIVSDFPVSLSLDGEFIGTSDVGKQVKAESTTGQHILRITPEKLPNESFSETIEIKGGTQVVKNLQLKLKLKDALAKQEAIDREREIIEQNNKAAAAALKSNLLGDWRYGEGKEYFGIELKADDTGTITVKQKRRIAVLTKYEFVFVTWKLSEDRKQLLFQDRYSETKYVLDILEFEPAKTMKVKDEDGVELVLTRI